MRRLVAIVVLGVAACGNDEEIPVDAPVAVDAPPPTDAPPGLDADDPDAAVIDAAAIDAPVDAAIDAPVDAAIDAVAAEDTEAYQNLVRLRDAAMAYHLVHGGYVNATHALTPAAACCAQPGQVCAPVAADWQPVPWSTYGFSIEAPHRYQYNYVSAGAGASFTAVARGDLDCDGTTSDFTLACSTAAGMPSCVITNPMTVD